MLINHVAADHEDPILLVVSGGERGKRIRTGVYQTHHFGSSHWPTPDCEHYPDLPISPYGVADTVEQILEQCPELEASNRKFLLQVTPVRKRDQESWGGWRWHKWGPYIGVQKPTAEYLYDEPKIEEIIVYHIYEFGGGDDHITSEDTAKTVDAMHEIIKMGTHDR